MRDSRRHSSASWLAGALLAAAPAQAADLRAGLPPIVFVSRTPPAGAAAGQVPGLGPHGTFVTGQGALMEWTPGHGAHVLMGAPLMTDVADPAVSPDGRRVAYAGVERPGDRWRIYVLDRERGDSVCVTCDSRENSVAADDADPCWWGDSLVFASTRAGGRALYDGSAVTQLWLRTPDGQLSQLTHEANGALDPVRDERTGRLVFSRWWFNPWVSAREAGLTRDPARALAPDSVNVWQVVSATLARDSRGAPGLSDVRLAAGGVVPRRRGMGIQPAVAPGGGVLAVSARNTGLAPQPGTLSLQRYGAPPAAGQRLAGAAIGDDTGDPYTENANLAAPAACAPAPLPDGRVLYSLDPGGHGEFGLWVMSADGESRERLFGEPGRLELDPAVVPVPRARGPVRPARARIPVERVEPQRDSAYTFRYLDTDVFAGKGAPSRTTGARLHVYRLVSADSVETLHDIPVPRAGRVELQLPADTPLFEQLTDAAGRALMTAHGPAQVRGFNTGAPGATSRCQGCHLGHSVTPR